MKSRVFLFSLFFVLGTGLIWVYMTEYSGGKETLYGSWTRCIEGELKKTYTFDNKGNYTRQKEYFLQDNDCQGPLSYVHTLRGHYKTHKLKKLSGKISTQLEVHFTQATLQPITDETTDLYNEKTVCNIANWISGKERDVTGVLAEDCDQYKKGTTTYRYLEASDDYFKIGAKVFDPNKVVQKLKAGQYRKI